MRQGYMNNRVKFKDIKLRIEESSELDYLRKELRYMKTRTLFVLVASTWLVYLGMSTLIRMDFPYQYEIFFTIPVLLNAILWVFWGLSSYLNAMGLGNPKIEMKDFDVHDSYYLIDLLRYTLHKQQRRNLGIELVAAMQFAIMSAIWALSLLPRAL